MKTTTTNLLSQLTAEELSNLTKEVKETVANVTENKHKAFSSADLWDIQRRRRGASIRKYGMNWY